MGPDAFGQDSANSKAVELGAHGDLAVAFVTPIISPGVLDDHVIGFKGFIITIADRQDSMAIANATCMRSDWLLSTVVLEYF